MLTRKITEELMNWKQRRHHPLIISGLRQIGKTFIVRKFGEDCYRNVIYLDLRQNLAVHSAFEGNFEVDQMVMSITAMTPGAHFVPGETLLILDEIQDCPNARSSLKYWDLDGRYDVIATGSFLGVKGFRDPYPRGIPVGYEENISMYPLTFREFLVNTGMQKTVMDYVEKCIREGVPVDPTVHRAMRSLYYQFLIVGGMPEAVNVFLKSHDLNAVRDVQRQILRSIRDDFGRYKDSNGEDRINETLKLRAEACLDSMPAQLSKEYKKFQFSLVNTRSNSTEKADGLQYLVDVGLVVKSYNLKDLTLPLEGNKIPSQFKVFYIDTGLLISQLAPGTAANVLRGDLGAYKGAVAENMVASAFAESGRQLYYYHAPSGSPELDFVYEEDGESVILECKSTNNRATSMKFVLANPKRFGRHPAVKLSDTNIGKGDHFRTLPLYSLGFSARERKKKIIPAVDVSHLHVPE